MGLKNNLMLSVKPYFSMPAMARYPGTIRPIRFVKNSQPIPKREKTAASIKNPKAMYEGFIFV
jgi:hypothetical protein